MFYNYRTLCYSCQVMSPASRTPSNQVAREVLSAALSILDAEGPDGFTVRAIAERANVAPMAIYNHFDGINGVLEALWIEGFTTLREAIDVRTAVPDDDLLRAGLGYRAFALAHRGLYTVMFMHRFRNFEPTLGSAQLAAQTFATLVDCVERCQPLGYFSVVRASDAAQVIWSSCHGYVALELLGINFATDRDATFDLLLETLRDGFH